MNHGTAADPICLDGEEEATDDMTRKRSSIDVSVGNEKKDGGGQGDFAKRPRMEGETDSTQAAAQNTPQVPIKLFATIQNEQVFNAAGDQSSPFRNCHTTLREMLGLDDMRHHLAMKWIVGCNYLVNFDYLIETIPEILSCPRTVFFYGHAETSPETWQRVCTQADGTSTADFVRLVPSDPPRTSTNPLPFSMPYGVHHTKMFLIGFSDGTLRVIIHTANLRMCDIHLKAQGAYIQDFPLKQNPYAAKCEFENDLISYIESYQYHTSHTWDGDNRTLSQELRRYDFSSARAVLIPSIPGRHSLTKPPLGHLKLRRAIQEHTVATNSVHNAVVCQFSSMGSLTIKWLADEFLVSTSQIDSPPGTSLAERIKFVYPTVEEVRSSLEGYQGGCSVPGTQKNVLKKFLQPLYCRWSSDDLTNPCEKSHNIPHIKTYYQLNEDDSSMKWFVLTSHNMSKAAWGEVQYGQFGRHIHIRHWELGVFVSPTLVAGEPGHRLVPFGVNASQESDIQIPLPYKVLPDAYGASDRPWMVDAQYTQADRFGLFMA